MTITKDQLAKNFKNTLKNLQTIIKLQVHGTDN